MQSVIGGTVLVAAGLILLLARAGLDVHAEIWVPLVVLLVGAVIALRQLDISERARWFAPAGGSQRMGFLRLAAGVVLAVVGILLLVARGTRASDLLPIVVASLAVLLGVGPGAGAVGPAALARPRAGARSAGAGGRAGRDRRPPARLGAADPGADPAPAGRRGRGGPAGPGPGARAPRLAVRRDTGRRGHPPGRGARGRGRGRGRPRRTRRPGRRRRPPGRRGVPRPGAGPARRAAQRRTARSPTGVGVRRVRSGGRDGLRARPG